MKRFLSFTNFLVYGIAAKTAISNLPTTSDATPIEVQAGR